MQNSHESQGGVAARQPLLRGTAGKVLRTAEKWLLATESALGIILVAAMFLLLVTQVITRNIVHLPLFWIEEVARLTMIWLVLIGVGFGVGKGLHLTVTAIVDRFRATPRIWIGRLVLLIVITTSIPLLWAAWELVGTLGAITTSSGALPRSLFFIPTVIGYALATVHAVIRILAYADPVPANLSEIEAAS